MRSTCRDSFTGIVSISRPFGKFTESPKPGVTDTCANRCSTIMELFTLTFTSKVSRITLYGMRRNRHTILMIHVITTRRHSELTDSQRAASSAPSLTVHTRVRSGRGTACNSMFGMPRLCQYIPSIGWGLVVLDL